MTESKPLPRVPFVNQWPALTFGRFAMVVGTVDFALLLFARVETHIYLIVMSTQMLALWISRRRWESRVRRAIESGIREIGPRLDEGEIARPPAPPIPFLGDRDLLAERNNRAGYVLLGAFLLALLALPVVIPVATAGWESVAGMGVVLAVYCGVWVGIAALMLRTLLRVRRDDAAVDRWQADLRRAENAAREIPGSPVEWPTILFGFDWDSRIDGLRESWDRSGLASQELVSDIRALAQSVEWLRATRTMPNPTGFDREIHRKAIRLAAWALTRHLDPNVLDVKGAGSPLSKSAPSDENAGPGGSAVRRPLISLAMILSLGLAAAPPPAVAQGSRVETGPASQPSDSDEIRIEGRAIAVDQEGKEHPNENGKLTAWIGPGTESRTETIRVVEGRWTLVVRRNALLSIANLRLGSQAAFVRIFSQFTRGGVPIPANGQITVRGTWLPKTTIRVVDAARGGALSNVSVVTSRAWTSEDVMDPSTLIFGATVVATGESPVEVEWRDGGSVRIRYWVRAPGYAWESLEVDHAKGGEQTVALAPEGTFVVKWNGPAPDGASVRLYRASSPNANYCSKQRIAVDVRAEPYRRDNTINPDAQFPCASQESLRIDSIKPGRYLLAIEVGESDARPLVLAERWIEVALGDSGTVDVILGRMPDPGSGSLSGILVLPSETASGSAWLSILQSDALDTRRMGRKGISLSDMEPVVGKPREYAWHVEDLPAGEYRICGMPGPVAKSVTLTSEGLRDVRLELPTMVTVNLHLVDADTGLGIEADQVLWTTGDDDGDRLMGGFRVSGLNIPKRTAESGVWTFVAPVGSIHVEPVARGYSPSWTETIDVEPGRSDVTIRAARAMGVRIRVVDKATNTPIEGEDVAFYGLVDPVDGSDETNNLARGGLVAVGYVSTPGKYRVRLRPPDGYKKPKNKIVTIEKGQITDVVFGLEKYEK